MNLGIAILILVGVTAGAIAAMLLVRRTAPDGGCFKDGDRAAGPATQEPTAELGEQRNPWGVELFETLRTLQPQTSDQDHPRPC